MDLLLLVAGGLFALLAGVLVAILSPGRLVSLTAGAALACLGLLQFGFARAVYELATTGRSAWFGYTLALALPVSVLWLLLAVLLGRIEGRGMGGWRPYLMLQVVLSILAAAYAFSRPTPDGAAPPSSQFRLEGREGQMLALLLLNVILLAAKFEATYLSLTSRFRNAFRPALLGVHGCSGLLAYLIVYTLITGGVTTEDVTMGAAPAMLLSFLLPLSLIRGRIGEAHGLDVRLPVTATNSAMIACAFVASMAALVWLTRAAGFSFGEGLLVISIGGVLASVAAFTFSNRLRRRIELLLDPIWYEPRAARRAPRGGTELEQATSLEELCGIIPTSARAVADIDPVTLFLDDPATRSYRPVSSTLTPCPDVTIADDEPLAIELRRSRRPIRLEGRSDDLEYVGIYVENAAQILACGAVCAVPIHGETGLVGFLLCGARDGGRQVHGEEFVLLGIAARQYADRIDHFLRQRAPDPTTL